MQFLERLRPFSTLHIRLGLNLEGRLNTLVRSRMMNILGLYYAQSKDVAPAKTPRTYLRSRVHPYPGLGHQVSVWLAGFLWAQDLSLEYLGGNVTRNGGLLDLADGQLPEDRHRGRVVTVRLPPTTDERNQNSVKILRGAVARAKRRHAKADVIIFSLALDNPRYDQIPAAAEVRRALLAGLQSARFSESAGRTQPSVVVHVRRGDINESSQGAGAGLSRWIGEDFYADVIRNIRGAVGMPDLQVDVISLGVPADFPQLSGMGGVRLLLNGDSAEDVVRLACADILVTAPSSFSFTAALASTGAVLALHPWWHEIPDTGRWFRLDQAGNFHQARLRSLILDKPKATSGS